jgi:dihydroorotase
VSQDTALLSAPDLLITGGRVIDPATGRDETTDVAVRNGRITAIGPGLAAQARPPRADYPPHPGTQFIDATGLIVVPGLIDLHTHVFTGVCPLTVPADETSMGSGVTTVVSAGDAGANTIEGFRHLAVHTSRTRVLAFLHISSIGLAGWPLGEAVDLDFLDVEAAARAAELHSDIVVGVKVRHTAPLIVGSHGLEPLRRARQVAARLDIPVMVHIGAAPAPLAELLAELAPGDIVTHCYTGSGNGLVEGGRVIREAYLARERGVLFDVGHGFGSFDYDVAIPAANEGFWPDCISTDLHSLSAEGPATDLPTTMSKLLNLGMDLFDVIAAVTSAPAAAIGRSEQIGSLRVSGCADIAVLEVVEGDHVFSDAFGHSARGANRIRARHTVRGGIPWRGPLPHPGRVGASLPF